MDVMLTEILDMYKCQFTEILDMYACYPIIMREKSAVATFSFSFIMMHFNATC